MTRRRLAPERRRRELLDAARDVLRAGGAATTRVEDVTHRAGAAKGTFYVYFDSWDTMLADLRDELLVDYRSAVMTRFATGGDNWDKFVDDEIERFVDHQLGLGALHEVLFHSPIGRPIPDEINAPALIAALLRLGRERGYVDPGIDTERIASMLFHLLHGAVDDVASGANRERTLAALKHVIRRTVRVGDGESSRLPS